MPRSLAFLLCILVLGFLSTPLLAQAAAIELSPADAAGRKVGAILFKRIEAGRVINAPPLAVSLAELRSTIRTTQGATLGDGDIEADVAQLRDVQHFFPSVRVEIKGTEDPLESVDVTFICEDPTIASFEILELSGAWWGPASPEAKYLVNTSITLGAGDIYSIEQVDRDIRERLMRDGRFVDVRELRRYAPDGVHLMMRVVTSRQVDRMLLAGVHEGSIEDLKEDTRFDRLRYAGPDTVASVKRDIRQSYLGKGHAFVDVTHQVIQIPGDNSVSSIAAAYPELATEEVELLHEEAKAEETILLFTISEGPYVQVGGIEFVGLEKLVDVPGSDSLEPGTLPSSMWPIWYSLSFAEREDRVRRALFRVMPHGPSLFSPKPDYVLEHALQDASFLEDHLRKAGWLDATVQMSGIQYNEDRSRVILSYSLDPGPLYVLTAIGVRVTTRPPVNKPDAPNDEQVASYDDIYEAIDLDGTRQMGLEGASLGEDYHVLVLEKPRSYDDIFFNGDPLEPNSRGINREIEAKFGEHGYSRIYSKMQPVYLEPETMIERLPAGMERQPAGIVGVVLVMDIDQGNKYRIGMINVRGNEATKTSVIRRQMRISPGDEFDIELMRRGADRLRRLGWFNRASPQAGVVITPRFQEEPSSPDVDYLLVDLYVDVIEGDTGSINASASYSPGGGFAAGISITKANFDLFDWPTFTGAGQNISLTLQPPLGETETYSLTFGEPFLFGYPLSFSATALITGQDFGPYTREERGGRFSLGYRLFDDFDLIFTYRYFENEILDVADDASFRIRRELGTTIFAGPSIEGVYNTLNALLFPTDGIKASLEFLVAGEAFGGDANFYRVTGKYGAAFHLGSLDDQREVALFFKSVGVYQRTYGDTDQIPLAQRQFLGSVGNLASLRGYRRNGVGPQAGSDAIGGNFMLSATAEVSMPIQPGFLWGVLFVDAGELVPEIEHFDPSGISASWGFGVRILLPVFPTPFGIDFGWPLYDQPGNRRQVVALNLTVGF